MGGELRGLRALVTGASKGIGYAVATHLRDEGVTVLGTARTPPHDLPKICSSSPRTSEKETS